MTSLSRDGICTAVNVAVGARNCSTTSGSPSPFVFNELSAGGHIGFAIDGAAGDGAYGRDTDLHRSG